MKLAYPRALLAFCALASGLMAATPSYFANTGVLWSNVNDPTEARAYNCAQYALEAYAYGDAEAQVVQTLGILKSMQNLVPDPFGSTPAAGAGYGNFKWRRGDTSYSEPNSVQFVTRYLIVAYLRYGSQMSQPVKTELLARLAAALTAIKTHDVKNHYTNIYLLKTWNLIGAGQILADTGAVQSGREQLFNWLAYTRSRGVFEYLSPQYYAHDVESLALLWRYADSVTVRAAALKGLRYFWADLAANWLPAQQRLGGAMSRSYDFLKNTGEIDTLLFNADWLTTRSPSQWKGYDKITLHRPDSTYINRFDNPRVILRDFSREDSVPANQAYQRMVHVVDGNSSVSSSEFRYDDWISQSLVINLPEPDPEAPVINYVMEGRSDPYMQAKVATGSSGIKKQIHLKPFIASVQKDREVLFLASSTGLLRGSSPVAPDASTVGIQSSIVFPQSAEIWVGTATTALALANGGTFDVPAGSTIFLRRNGVAAAFRFLLSTGMQGSSVALKIVADGSANKARRITALHLDGIPTATSGRAHLALWTRVADVATDSAYANFRQTMLNAAVTATLINNQTVNLTVPGLSGAMTVVANTATERITSLSGGYSTPAAPNYSLNINDGAATDLGPILLADPASISIGALVGGTTALSGEKITLGATGGEIYGTSDFFRFHHEALVGDGEVITKVDSFSNGISSWAKAGIMLRASTATTAPNATLYVTGANGLRFNTRTTDGGISNRTGITGITPPVWLKLKRVGSVITAHYSLNGTAWMQVGAPATLSALPVTARAGICFCANGSTTAATASFGAHGLFPGDITLGSIP